MATTESDGTAGQRGVEARGRPIEASSPARSLARSPTRDLSDRKDDFRAGFVATMPLWLGVAPFGAIYAVSALSAGLDWAQTLAMSLLVFAGASQFTAAGLFAAGVAPLTIVVTTLVINARHALLAASVAPFVREVRPPAKALMAFQLTDESYAIGMRKWLAGQGSAAYQFGANVSLYVIWQASTIAGIGLSTLLASFSHEDLSSYGLDLIFPLTFIGLLVPLLRERVSAAVALLAGALTIGGAMLLPGSWYILIAGLVASGVGAAMSRRPRGTGHEA
jgi:4-azaleucine resistance transporter AzlC